MKVLRLSVSVIVSSSVLGRRILFKRVILIDGRAFVQQFFEFLMITASIPMQRSGGHCNPDENGEPFKYKKKATRSLCGDTGILEMTLITCMV